MPKPTMATPGKPGISAQGLLRLEHPLFPPGASVFTAQDSLLLGRLLGHPGVNGGRTQALRSGSLVQSSAPPASPAFNLLDCPRGKAQR